MGPRSCSKGVSQNGDCGHRIGCSVILKSSDLARGAAPSGPDASSANPIGVLKPSPGETDLARRPRRRSPLGVAARHSAIQGSRSHIAVARGRKPPFLIAPLSLNKLDSDDLPKPDRRGSKTNVGYVEGSVWAKRHAGRQAEDAARAVYQYFLLAVWQDADQASRRGFGSRVTCRERSFQYIHSSPPIEGYTEHLAEPRGDHFDITARRDVEHALGVDGIWIKPSQIADVEDTVLIDHRRDHVTLRSRDVNDPRYLAGGRDLVELAVVRLHGIQIPADGYHAVPRSVRLEVAGDRIGWIGNWVRLLERAQVRDHRPAPVRIHADDPVGNAGHAVRAAGTGEDRVEGIANERDVGDAASKRSSNARW